MSYFNINTKLTKVSFKEDFLRAFHLLLLSFTKKNSNTLK